MNVHFPFCITCTAVLVCILLFCHICLHYVLKTSLELVWTQLRVLCVVSPTGQRQQHCGCDLSGFVSLGH